jgi:hypothetical protein
MTQQKTTGYQISKLAITLKTGEVLDVRNVFQEINLYDSIFTPCISGSIIITDSIGLINRLAFDGNESIVIEIGKDESNIKFSKGFRIHKLTDRKYINQSTEAFVLHFTSDQFILSQQLKVNQTYQKTTYDNMVSLIMKDYLRVNQIVSSTSEGLRTIVVPNLNPIDAVQWIAKRALDKNASPNFLFFENKLGYNFVSLTDIINQPGIAKINFDVKNLEQKVYDKDRTYNGNKFGQEFLGARDVKILTQYNFLDGVKSGVYASSLVGFDPVTRKVNTFNMSFKQHYEKNSHLGETPNIGVMYNQDGSTNITNYDSRKIMYYTGLDRQSSKYIQKNDPQSYYNTEDAKYILERKAVMKNFLNKRVRVVMPGNFNLTSGINIDLRFQEKQDQSLDGDNKDYSAYGKYTIIGARHIISYNKHETIFDAASDSTSYPTLIQTSSKSTETLIGFA